MRADGADERVERGDGHWLLIEWFVKGHGVLGVDRRRTRERGADHARATEHAADGSVVKQWIRPAPEIDELVAAFGANAGPVREQIVSMCARCNEGRISAGRRGFLENVAVAANLGFEGRRTELDIYACPTCKSVELFLASPPRRAS